MPASSPNCTICMNAHCTPEPLPKSVIDRTGVGREWVRQYDEAHHVHDPDLEWSKSLTSVHRALLKGLSLGLDFSAKDQNGMYCPGHHVTILLRKPWKTVMMLREGWDVKSVTVALG